MVVVEAEYYFIQPGVFGTEAAFPTAEDRYARLYRAFIIEGALMGATVFSIEPPQDIWEGDSIESRHFAQVILSTLRQLIAQRLIASKEEVLRQARIAYQLPECRTLQQYDGVLQDLDLELGRGNLERAVYGALFPHLMKEMIPDTAGRYYFIPLLPVGTPPAVAGRFARVLSPGEGATPEAYRDLLDRYYPATENSRSGGSTNRACVLKCGRAIAVLQSRENLFERQPFSVDVPAWTTSLAAHRERNGLRLNWTAAPEARSYGVWKRRAGTRVYPEWDLLETVRGATTCFLAGKTGGTFGVSARTVAKRRLEGTVNFGEYLLFTADESPIREQIVITANDSRLELVGWTDETLPEKQEVWRCLEGVPEHRQAEANEVLETFRQFIAALEAKDLERLMAFYAPGYRDSNGYSLEYVRRAWLWWFQRTVNPYVVAQVRHWDAPGDGTGELKFTAWNRCRATMIWDEPFGCHGRVWFPRHADQRVTWTWQRSAAGHWQVRRTEPALPNFGEMLWNSRGHDAVHSMTDFADTPASHGGAPGKPGPE